MGFEDQACEQAILVQQDGLNPYQAAKKLAIFNADGSPAVLMTSDEVEDLINESLPTPAQFQAPAGWYIYVDIVGAAHPHAHTLDPADYDAIKALIDSPSDLGGGLFTSDLIGKYFFTSGTIPAGSLGGGFGNLIAKPQAAAGDVILIALITSDVDGNYAKAGLGIYGTPTGSGPYDPLQDGVSSQVTTDTPVPMTGFLLNDAPYAIVTIAFKIDPEDGTITAPTNANNDLLHDVCGVYLGGDVQDVFS